MNVQSITTSDKRAMDMDMSKTFSWIKALWQELLLLDDKSNGYPLYIFTISAAHFTH